MLAASPARLRRTLPREEAALEAIAAFRAAAAYAARRRFAARSVLDEWEALLEYLQLDLASPQIERFRVLYLDAKLRLLHDDLIAEGTIDECVVFPREVLRRALDVGAQAMILAHCHPSGDPTPSKADIAMTKHLVAVAGALRVRVVDHVIIGHGRSFSMRMEAML